VSRALGLRRAAAEQAREMLDIDGIGGVRIESIRGAARSAGAAACLVGTLAISPSVTESVPQTRSETVIYQPTPITEQ